VHMAHAFNRNQLWTFSNQQIKIFGGKCLDVTSGSTTST
jgi:hypothetical protein